MRRILPLTFQYSIAPESSQDYEGANLLLHSHNGKSPVPIPRKSLNPAEAVLTFGFYPRSSNSGR